MQPVGKIEEQPWMTAPATKRVVAALGTKGAVVRFVGGCVRDAILGRPVKDIDLATHDPPPAVIELLEAAGIQAIPTGIAHGTVTAVIGRDHFEITTLRLDVETDGRRARVAFTDDWMADAARRDLTINALLAAPDGTLYDPFGGLEDLKLGRIRFVGDPSARIREDVLRLLRFFRFYAHYGKPPIDEECRLACKELAHLLPTLSGERVAAETLKLLSAPDPARVVALMIEDGIVGHFLPEAGSVEFLRALVTVEGAAAGTDALRRLAALIDTAKGTPDGVARRLRLSNVESERLVELVQPRVRLHVDMSEVERRKHHYRLGAELFRDLSLLAWARDITALGSSDRRASEAWRDHLAFAVAWRPPGFPVRGRDALALGIPAGPKVGRLIAAVEAWWIEQDFAPDRDACLAKLLELSGN